MIAAAARDALEVRVVALVAVVMFAWSFVLYVAALRERRKLEEARRRLVGCALNESDVDRATERLRR